MLLSSPINLFALEKLCRTVSVAVYIVVTKHVCNIISCQDGNTASKA